MIARWGAPERILTDQGSNFTGTAMIAAYNHLGIQKECTTPRHLQCNGLVERYNRTLKDTIAKIALTNALKWDKTLDWAVAVYRSMPNSTTGETPLFAMLGMDPYLPIASVNPSRQVERNEGDINPLVDKSEILTGLTEIAANVPEITRTNEK